MIWKEVIGRKYSFYSWVLLFFWAIIPLNNWACSNNFLENTMNIFVSCSVLFLIKNIKTNRLVYIVISGVCLSLAFLSKGFTGIFPLSFFFWYFLAFEPMSFQEMMRKTLLLVTVTLIPFLLLYIFYPPAIQSLSNYISIQVINSVKYLETTNDRFMIIDVLFRHLRVINLLSVISIVSYTIVFFRKQILFILFRFKKFFISIMILAIMILAIETYPYENPLKALCIYTNYYINYYISNYPAYFYTSYLLLLLFLLMYKSRNNFQTNIISSQRVSWIFVFTLLGFSGVLPMIISLKQSPVYVLTALPYFSIPFIILLIPILDYISRRVRKKMGYFFAAILFMLFGPFISFSTTIKIFTDESWQLNSLKYQYERVLRDKALLDDIRLIIKKVPENTKLGMNFQDGYSLIQSYFYRYGDLILGHYDSDQAIYLISFEDGWNYNAIVGEYREINTIRTKKVTKQIWEKLSDNKRRDALLSIIKDPRDAEKHVFIRWDELPNWMHLDMTISEKDYLIEQRKKYKKIKLSTNKLHLYKKKEKKEPRN